MRRHSLLLGPAILLSYGLSSRLDAEPLSFEQRSPSRFQTCLGSHSVAISPHGVSLGTITLNFDGASPRSRLEGLGTPAPSTYLGVTSSQTFRQFPQLALRDLYPGIDAIFYGTQGQLEYDLLLAPGASPRSVKLSFAGASNLRIDDQGSLLVETPSGLLTQKLPRVFQRDGKTVQTRYVLLARNQVGLRIGPHDRNQPLTIDPELVFANNFGGTGNDTAPLIATDSQGNLYVAGTSNSIDFPTTSGLQSKVPPPLLAFSSSTQVPVSLPVGLETHVLAVGGTADGSVLYAAATGGFYASSDHGATWQKGAPLPVSNPFQSFTINAIAVDPVDPSRVYAATNQGLYFSSAGGQSWFLHVRGLTIGDNGHVNATSVIGIPTDRNIFYVTTTNPSGLFKSTDGGNTWLALNPTYPGEPVPYVPNSPIVLTLGPNGSDLYVVDNDATFLKSTDGGATWQPLAQNLYLTRALFIDPANPSNIYVSDNFGFQKSVDGGHVFAPIPSPPPMLTSPVQQLAVDASGTLYAGGSSSVYASTDGGATWTVVAYTPALHTLTALGGQVYAGYDSPPVPFIVKWDPTGTHILYSTFLGSTINSLSALKVDAQGNCVVIGYSFVPGATFISTLGPLPPTLPAGSPRAFVLKLNADGTQLVYSTLLGGSKGAQLNNLALDASGAVYLTGQTASPDFPTTAGVVQPAIPTAACTRPQTGFFVFPNLGTNAFVTKLNPDGSSIAWSTFLSGACGSIGESIAVDSAGQVVVAGFTNSPDFPASATAYQPAFPGPPDQTSAPNALTAGFVSRLSAAGDQVLASTYLGGGYLTEATALVLDSAGNVSLTGLTFNIAPGVTPGAFQTKPVDRCVPTINIGPGPPYYGTTDGFVLKLDPTLSTARYMTYLGGSCNDSGTGIALDPSGNAWITGGTQSSDFPLKGLYQGLTPSNRFVTELSADGSRLLYSSGTDGASLALAPSGQVYLAGSRATGGSMAAEVIRIDPSTTPPVVVDAVTPVHGFTPDLVYPTFGTGVVPGELVTITGSHLGPATRADAQLDASGRLPFMLANTSVLFDGIPAPLISVQDSAIVCFVPFEVSQSTSLVVKSGGQASNSVRLVVSASDPQILSIANQDGTLNTPGNPAQPGSVLVLYVSGLGETAPLSVDGLVNSTSRAVPIAPLNIYLPGKSLTPLFVGSAPGMIAGITQVNVALPASGYSSNKVNISIGIGGGYFYIAN